MIPVEVAAAWGWRETALAPHMGGLINKTFVVRDESGAPIAALQQLHPIFGAEVNLDIEAVTAHIAGKGMVTPRILRTLDDRAWVVHQDRVWRALSWVEGESVHTIPELEWADAGGRLVGRFHVAVADLVHEYKFTRSGVHDTVAHMRLLAECVARAKIDGDAAVGGGGAVGAKDDGVTMRDAVALGQEILDAAGSLPVLPELPKRHVHGDLKLSNLIFRRTPRAEGVCLVDLDTVARGTLAFELGDAMRSWCNPQGEDTTAIKFELPVFLAAIRGFRSVADPVVSQAERGAIGIGLELVCLELAARFAADVFRDSYFGWDPARFPSRRAHNLVRARGQLALGLSVRKSRDEVRDALLVGG